MEYYDSGLQFISNITRCREKINSLKDRINYGHKMIQANKGAKYQKDIIKEAEEELILFENEEKVQTEALMTLEGKMDSDFFKLLLENLGSVIARTSSFPHLEDNLHDENGLADAVIATGEAIRIKKYELDHLEPIADKQRTIVESQLRYFYNDMNQHAWGQQRLQELTDMPSLEGKARGA